MKTKELRQLSAEKLVSELKDAHKEIFNLRMQKAGGQLKKNHLFAEARRRIAKIKTLMHEKGKA